MVKIGHSEPSVGALRGQVSTSEHTHRNPLTSRFWHFLFKVLKVFVTESEPESASAQFTESCTHLSVPASLPAFTSTDSLSCVHASLNPTLYQLRRCLYNDCPDIDDGCIEYRAMYKFVHKTTIPSLSGSHSPLLILSSLFQRPTLPRLSAAPPPLLWPCIQSAQGSQYQSS